MSVHLHVSFSPFRLDPFALKRNVARSLNSQMVFEYIQERFRSAYKYFACPQKRGTEEHRRKVKAIREVEKEEAANVDEQKENGKGEKSQSTQRGLQGSEEEKEPDSDAEDGSDPTRKTDEKTLDSSLKDMVLSEENDPSLSPNGLLDSDEEEEGEEEEKEKCVPSADLHYVFDKMIFTGGKVTVLNSTLLHCLHVCSHLTLASPPLHPASNGCVQHLQTRWPPEGRVSWGLQEDRAEASAPNERPLQRHPGRALQNVLLYVIHHITPTGGAVTTLKWSEQH